MLHIPGVFDEHLQLAVDVLGCRHACQKAAASGHQLVFSSLDLHSIVRLFWHCPGYSSPAAELPNAASTWAGDAQVCWQNTLCILSLILKRLPKLSHGANCSREPRIFLTYTGEAIKGEIVTSPLNSWTAFLMKQIQPCFLWSTERVEQSTDREH